MMRIALWIFVIFVSATAIAVGAHYNIGYVLFILPPYRMDMSLNFMIVLLLGAIFGSYGIVRLLMKALFLPSTLRKMNERRRERNAYKAILDGVIAHFEGKFASAEKSIRGAMTHPECQSVGALIGASSAQHMNKPELRDEYLQKVSKDHELAKAMTQATLLIEQDKNKEALEVLALIESKSGANPTTLELQLRIYEQLGEWSKVVKIVDTLADRKYLNERQANGLRIQGYLELIKQHHNNIDELISFFHSIPKNIQTHDELISAVLNLLNAMPNAGKATSLFIEEQLKNHWNDSLLLAYAECYSEASEGVRNQIKFAEKQLSKHENDSVLLLILGQLCAKQQLWDKAEDYFNKSLGLEETSQAHFGLAQVFENNANIEQAFFHFKLSAQLSNLNEF